MNMSHENNIHDPIRRRRKKERKKCMIFKSTVASVWSYHSQNILMIMDCIGHLLVCSFTHSLRRLFFYSFRFVLFVPFQQLNRSFSHLLILFMLILNIIDTGHSALTKRKKNHQWMPETWAKTHLMYIPVIGHRLKDDIAKKGTPVRINTAVIEK